MKGPGERGTRGGTGHPGFLVDAMLGTVARDLRLLGYDAVFARGEPDSAILRQCQREGRVLVTRDRGLAARARSLPCVLVTATRPEEQVREVLRPWVGTPRPQPFSRCLVCNGALAVTSRGEAESSLPDHLVHAQRTFVGCAGCGRVYWHGSHGERLRARVRLLSRSLHPGGRPV